MKSVHLIHWNAAEAKKSAAKLRAAGYSVAAQPVTAASLRKLGKEPPAAIVVDLSRLPVQGRDVAIALRHGKATRHIPLVFVDGDPAKVARIKRHIPNAEYTNWNRVRSSLKRAIAHPPKDPLRPTSAFAGYAGVALVKKLGIKTNGLVTLVGAPRGFEKTLGALPKGAKLKRRLRGRADLIIWFAKSRKDLERRIAQLGTAAGTDGLWIAWPKRASGIASDLSQIVVRDIAEAHGLVDFKIAAIDEIWSGLRFTRRKASRGVD